MLKSLMFAAAVMLCATALSPAAEARTHRNGYFGFPFYFYQLGGDWRHRNGDVWFPDDQNGDVDYYHHGADVEASADIALDGPGAGSNGRYSRVYGSNHNSRYIDYEPRHRSLTCSHARRLVDRSGYDHVRTVNCNGRVFVFKAENRSGDRVSVRVNPRTGSIW